MTWPRSMIVLCLVVSGMSAHAAGVVMDSGLARKLSDATELAETDPDGALAALKKLADRWRHRPGQMVFVMQERAGLLLQQERFEDARRELAEVLDGLADDYAPGLRLMLAQVLLVLEAVPEALTMLETWRRGEKRDVNPQGLFLIGYAYVRLERFEDAIQPLEAAVTSKSRPLSMWIELLAYAYARLGRVDDAISLITGLVERFPLQTRLWRQLAGVFQAAEINDSAAATYAVLRELDDLSRAELRQIARFFAYLGLPEDGARWLRQARDEETGYEDVMLEAELWINAREFDAAMDVLQRAADVAPDGRPLLVLGQLFLHWERYDEAVRVLRASVDAYGEQPPPELSYYLALALANVNQPSEAREALSRISDPKFAQRVASLQRYVDSLE